MFYCVANMPGAVPEHLDLRADQRDAAVRRGAGRQGLGSRRCRDDHSLALGLNTHAGQLTNEPVGEARRHRRDQPGRGAGVGAETAAGPRSTELARAVRTYLDHLAVERGLAANTLTSYRRDLRRYLEYLDRARRRRPRRRHRGDGVRLPGARCARATPTTRR